MRHSVSASAPRGIDGLAEARAVQMSERGLVFLRSTVRFGPKPARTASERAVVLGSWGQVRGRMLAIRIRCNPLGSGDYTLRNRIQQHR